MQEAFVETSGGLATESLPSLNDFAEESSGGALPKGWYSAEIVEGYATRSGKQFETHDAPSKRGDSRNLIVCLSVTAGSYPRNLNELVNYKPENLTPEGLARITASRKEFAGVKGRWADRDAQSANLSIVRVAGLNKAVGTDIVNKETYAINPSILIGKRIDVRLDIDEKGYNVVREHAKAGSRTAKANGKSA